MDKCTKTLLIIILFPIALGAVAFACYLLYLLIGVAYPTLIAQLAGALPFHDNGTYLAVLQGIFQVDGIVFGLFIAVLALTLKDIIEILSTKVNEHVLHLTILFVIVIPLLFLFISIVSSFIALTYYGQIYGATYSKIQISNNSLTYLCKTPTGNMSIFLKSNQTLQNYCNYLVEDNTKALEFAFVGIMLSVAYLVFYIYLIGYKIKHKK